LSDEALDNDSEHEFAMAAEAAGKLRSLPNAKIQTDYEAYCAGKFKGHRDASFGSDEFDEITEKEIFTNIMENQWDWTTIHRDAIIYLAKRYDSPASLMEEAINESEGKFAMHHRGYIHVTKIGEGYDQIIGKKLRALTDFRRLQPGFVQLWKEDNSDSDEESDELDEKTQPIVKKKELAAAFHPAHRETIKVLADQYKLTEPLVEHFLEKSKSFYAIVFRELKHKFSSLV
jgi:hypothetical protein